MMFLMNNLKRLSKKFEDNLILEGNPFLEDSPILEDNLIL